MTHKIIIAPGAFKDCLSAGAAASAIERGLKRSGLDAELLLLPIADGGNGTLDAFLAGGGQRHSQVVHGPRGQMIAAEFGLLADGHTAVVEMALASGLELLQADERDPLLTSTAGTGELLVAALNMGAERIIVGMGGSATVDGGTGCLGALGVRFLDHRGQHITPRSDQLTQIARIDTSGLDPRWAEVEVVIACDVDNPTLGPNGAAAVFGPQKGASAHDVALLEENLRYFFALVHSELGVDVRSAPGGGAAGALSAGLMAFLNGHIVSGVDLLLNYSGFSHHLADADLVITGEGRMDEQTIYGKGPVGVARLAVAHKVPTVALVGGLGVDDAVLHEAGIAAVLPVINETMTLEEALSRSTELVESASLRLGYLLQLRQS